MTKRRGATAAPSPVDSADSARPSPAKPAPKPAPTAPLAASLAEHAPELVAARDELAAEAEAELASVEVEPIEPPELPADRAVLRMGELARRAAALPPGEVLHARGSAGSMPGLVVAELARGGRRVIAIAADGDEARHLAADARFALGAGDAQGARTVLVLPAQESSPYAEVAADRRAAAERLAVLAHLASERPWSVLVAPAQALARKVLPRDAIASLTLVVRPEDELDRDDLTRRLAATGYVRSPLVDDPGSFAVRGSLVDVWPPTSPTPLRIELYGDLVLGIKRFDPEDQRSGDDVSEALLCPAREVALTPEAQARAREVLRDLCDEVNLPSSKARALIDDVVSGRAYFGAEGFVPAFFELAPLASYLPSDALLVLAPPSSATRAVRDELGRAVTTEGQGDAPVRFPVSAFYQPEVELARALGRLPAVALHELAVAGGDASLDSLERFEACAEDAPSLAAWDQSSLVKAIADARGAKGKGSALDPLVARLLGYQAHRYRVLLTAHARTQVERLVSLLRHRGIRARARLEPGIDPIQSTPSGEVVVTTGRLSRGLVAPAELLALVTEEEVFGARAERKASRAKERSSKKAAAFLEDLRSLAVGDYVVHTEHGIGRYQGLVHREVASAVVDLLSVEYAGGDKLFVPVHRLGQVQKYAGGDATPKLDRLGGSTFAKTKAHVKQSVRQMADELLRLYADRRAATGEPVAEADDDYRTFEAGFPFDETADQARAIAEVSSDLESKRPMDRLVCGDVGFGKTEVAIRAAYRVAVSGKQVAVLCPTTVLAQQHYHSFASRFAGTPLVVRALSRFQTKAEQDATLKGLKQGSVDVVVGTHRLLSKDVHFARLGLLVVDEEQRFGVAHKERIKAMRTDVHVLTLSATPIPRTLQMAITGLRDMSIIHTPPADRRAIRTIVTRHDEAVIRDAVTRELGRGGQVFYVYNRVEGLYERAARLQALVPSARIAVAHGQLAEGPLERTMLDFVEGKHDVLCATAIIESGLDIPRANTMIVDRADLFGLSQLYQLRGRVGRSRERAYCYLVVPPPNAMTDESRSRIEALERHSELGAGFQIASLDLELRGAGDLLGGDQSGNVASVGLEMFCQLLDEAVHELRGDAVVHDIDPELSIDVSALLPESYVSEVGVRLSLYKRLASASSEAEVMELAEEMEDRFGSPPSEAARFVQLMRMKVDLRRIRAFGCDATARSVALHLRDDTTLDGAKLLKLVQQKGSAYRLTPDGRLTRRSREAEVFASGLEALERTLAELAPCRRDDA